MPFYSKQLHAAYIPENVYNVMQTWTEPERNVIHQLYLHAGAFECVTNFKLKELGKNSRTRLLAVVAQNIMQRGMPTFVPRILKRLLSSYSDKINFDGMVKTLLFVDDKYEFVDGRRYYQKNFDGTVTPAEINSTELSFLLKIFSSTSLKNIAQFMEMQKPFEHVILSPNTEAKNYTNYTQYCLNLALQDILDLVKDNRLDFSIELPKISNAANCIAVELDGPTHEEPVQRSKDKMRDDILKELYWATTIRIKNIDDGLYGKKLLDFAKPYGKYLADNNIAVIDSVKTAVFVARIARTLLMLVEHDELSVYDGKEHVMFIDEFTDKKSICYGILNSYNMLYHLMKLLGGSGRSMASAYLSFSDGDVFEIKPDGSYPIRSDREFDISEADIHINESMTHRLYAFNPEKISGRTVWLFSSYAPDCLRSLQFGRSLIYEFPDTAEDSLRYFLQEIFRKEDFRPKQIDIIRAALQRKNVIGLLPTGSGKTVTFQLSVLLQPGIGIVIAPLISLMEDQVVNLKKNLIDIAASINSTQSGLEKRLLLKKMSDGEYGFFYIAPERLQIASFRDMLSSLSITTLVIDEAHCVSQWGHDFRTSYLRIGDTMEKYLSGYITMALTGTASCNVITDIKRELNMSRNVSIIKPNDFRRSELHFKILEQAEDIPLEKRIQSGAVQEAIVEAVKQLSCCENLKDLEDGSLEKFFRHENDKYANAGLVFCPFAKKKDASTGVIAKEIARTFFNEVIDVYHGQLDASVKKRAQEKFTDGQTAILVATKAFGMGIDKPNIRFTIHTTVPESIESFYQEAGRAGRDRLDAVNIIVAPPRSLQFESVEDKSISDFFLNLSFPPKEDFLRRINELLRQSYVVSTTMGDAILGKLEEMDLSEEASIAINSRNHVIELNINKGNTQAVYAIEVNDANEVKFIPIQDAEDNPLFINFVAKIIKSIKDKILGMPIKSSDHFYKLFDITVRTETKSLAQLFGQLKGKETSVCYVGLDASSLINWVENIIKELLRQTKNRGDAAKFKISTATMKRIKGESKKAEKDKWKYDPKRFYTIYCTLCSENKLTPCNEVEYLKMAEGCKPNWKGMFTGLQDKLLYYMGVLGLYSTYERDYAANCAKITVRAVDVQKLKDNIRRYISSYETSDYVRRQIKLDWLDRIKSPEEQVYKALEYIIDYSYDKIRSHRYMQEATMYTCIQANNPGDDSGFTNAIYQYFESKYTDDLLRDVENENLNLPAKWIDKISEAIKEGENILEDLSHLRTSALKVEEARPQAFTPYLLYAYATFQDHNLDIRSGLSAYVKGQHQLKMQRSNYRSTLSGLCVRMFDTTDTVYLQEVKKIIDLDYQEEKEALSELMDVVHHNITM